MMAAAAAARRPLPPQRYQGAQAQQVADFVAAATGGG